MQLDRYSIGIGDRFARQGKAQLQAIIQAKKCGVAITPIWNKSNREHLIVRTHPGDVRREADAAVQALGWSGPYYVDADHVNLRNVDRFLEASDFFTLDIAEYIGKPAREQAIAAFVHQHEKYIGVPDIPGLKQPFTITKKEVTDCARKYLSAVQKAGNIYRHIEAAKGPGSFIAEVSMDETAVPQTPLEWLFILAAIAAEGIPAQTIAPKFIGRFNKGVDYIGEVTAFTDAFESALAVIAFAVSEFNLPKNLKLSVHSGSDKFSIYGPIHAALKKFNTGLHLKTAGTTWLEELIGLSLSGEDGLQIAKNIYYDVYERFYELCEPYADVIDINKKRLPAPEAVKEWCGEEYAAALRHDPSCEQYNLNFRQLLHVGYKVAAELGAHYVDALETHASIIAENVTENLFERHIRPVFIGA